MQLALCLRNSVVALAYLVFELLASGLVALDVPPGLVVEPAAPLRYELAGGGFAAWDLTARALPGASPGGTSANIRPATLKTATSSPDG